MFILIWKEFPGWLISIRPEGEYIIGSNRKRVFEGMSDDFDGVILLGYHAMAGTENGIMDHTYSSKTWYNYQ
ncbi:MAG: M55 family metallopeptidase, partial [bacterium]|nr:M55 family metallopeptidase [bacterium]